MRLMIRILRRLPRPHFRFRAVEFGAGFSLGIVLVSVVGVGIEEWKIASNAYQMTRLDKEFSANILLYRRDVQKLSQDQEAHIRGQVEYIGVGLLGAMGVTALMLAKSTAVAKEAVRKRPEDVPPPLPPPVAGVIPDTVWMPPSDDPTPSSHDAFRLRQK